jgi:hypothetical protein
MSSERVSEAAPHAAPSATSLPTPGRWRLRYASSSAKAVVNMHRSRGTRRGARCWGTPRRSRRRAGQPRAHGGACEQPDEHDGARAEHARTEQVSEAAGHPQRRPDRQEDQAPRRMVGSLHHQGVRVVEAWLDEPIAIHEEVGTRVVVVVRVTTEVDVGSIEQHIHESAGERRGRDECKSRVAMPVTTRRNRASRPRGALRPGVLLAQHSARQPTLESRRALDGMPVHPKVRTSATATPDDQVRGDARSVSVPGGTCRDVRLRLNSQGRATVNAGKLPKLARSREAGLDIPALFASR